MALEVAGSSPVSHPSPCTAFPASGIPASDLGRTIGVQCDVTVACGNCWYLQFSPRALDSEETCYCLPSRLSRLVEKRLFFSPRPCPQGRRVGVRGGASSSLNSTLPCMHILLRLCHSALFGFGSKTKNERQKTWNLISAGQRVRPVGKGPYLNPLRVGFQSHRCYSLRRYLPPKPDSRCILPEHVDLYLSMPDAKVHRATWLAQTVHPLNHLFHKLELDFLSPIFLYCSTKLPF